MQLAAGSYEEQHAQQRRKRRRMWWTNQPARTVQPNARDDLKRFHTPMIKLEKRFCSNVKPAIFSPPEPVRARCRIGRGFGYRVLRRFPDDTPLSNSGRERSHSHLITPISRVTMTMVTLNRLLMPSKHSKTLKVVAESRAEVGSSATNTCGLAASARAMPTRCSARLKAARDSGKRVQSVRRFRDIRKRRAVIFFRQPILAISNEKATLLNDGAVVQQDELLKHHADISAEPDATQRHRARTPLSADADLAAVGTFLTEVNQGATGWIRPHPNKPAIPNRPKYNVADFGRLVARQRQNGSVAFVMLGNLCPNNHCLSHTTKSPMSDTTGAEDKMELSERFSCYARGL